MCAPHSDGKGESVHLIVPRCNGVRGEFDCEYFCIQDVAGWRIVKCRPIRQRLSRVVDLTHPPAEGGNLDSYAIGAPF